MDKKLRPQHSIFKTAKTRMIGLASSTFEKSLFLLLMVSFLLVVCLYPIFPNRVVEEDLDTFSAQEHHYFSSSSEFELYVPAIAIIKEGTVSMDCTTIEFTYLITNESTNSEVLENVEVTDPDLGGIIGSSFTGDTDNDKLLDIGETWILTQTYNIVFQDVVNGQFGENPASVTANLEGQLGVLVNDTSHPTNILDDGPTIVDLTSCENATMGLVKDWSYQDLNNDGCPESILYDLTVSNLGSVDLYDLVLMDPLIINGPIPGPIQGTDIGNDTILSAGESWEYHIIYIVDANDIVGGVINNQATIIAKRTDTHEEVSDLSHPSDTNGNADTSVPIDEFCAESGPRIGIVKTGALVDTNGNGCPESVNYTFLVSNIGDVDLDTVSILDGNLEEDVMTNPLQGTDQNNDGVLSVGETWSFEALYAITPKDLVDMEIVNHAVASAEIVNFDYLVLDDSHFEDRNLDAPTITNIEGVCVPGIGLIKTATAIDLNADGCRETIQYTFEVANTGTEDLVQVILSDVLFGEFGEDINGPLPGSDINEDDVLSVNEIWTYEVFYPITQSEIDMGTVINQAQVNAVVESSNDAISDDSHPASFYEDGNTELNVAGVSCPAEARIGLIKTASANLLDLDGDTCPETIRYEFTVANTGSIVLDELQLTDNLLGGEVTGLDEMTDDNDDGLLFPNETWTYEAFYPITQSDIDIGSVTNQAQVIATEQISNNPIMDDSDDDSFDENEDTITSTAGACVAESGIGLIKSAPTEFFQDLDNDGCVENIQYTFTVRNTGAIPLQQIVLLDPLLGNAPINGPLPGNDVDNDGILFPGETWTYQSLYPITEQNIDIGSVTNQATVTAVEEVTANIISDDSDDDSFNENDETVTSVVGACAAEAQITLIKDAIPVDSDNDGCPETIRYTFTIDNVGAIDLYQIAINDNKLPGPINGPSNGSDTGTDEILSTTETWIFESIYTITQSDYEAGLVTNQAEVVALEVPSDTPIESVSNEAMTSFGDLCDQPVDPIAPTNPDFEIFNGITPNGDGLNDYFEIRGIEDYPDNFLQVFNRWGVLVFEAQGYGTDSSLFTGQSEGMATVAKDRKLPTGTYFYTLSFTGNNPGREVYTGYLYINRD